MLKYERIKGYIWPKKFHQFAEKYENFNVYPDDIWVMGCPKTGTTWTQEMVWCIMNNNDFERSKTLPLRKKFPNFELNCFELKQICNGEPWELDVLNYCENLERPRLIKTHFGWPLIPKQIRTGEVKPKLLYIHRNYFDVCLSAYEFSKAMGLQNATLEKFVNRFVENKMPYTPCLQHVKEFFERRTLPNLMFISYEELSNDLVGVIRKTANFLERDFSDEQVEALAKHLDFDVMKNNKSVSIRVVDGVEVPLTRKGVSGDYKNYFSKELIEKIEREIEKNKIDENVIKGYDDN